MTLSSDIKACSACVLRDTCTQSVPSSGSINAPVMLIGEAPGRDEDREGKTFIGKAGKELDNYLRRIKLYRSRCYVANVVKCRPKGDSDPPVGSIEVCKALYLDEEIAQSEAFVIGLLGATACRTILGKDFNLEMKHGIPQERGGRTYLPMYHPAAGLHNTTQMIHILNDFAALRSVLSGDYKSGWVTLPHEYVLLDSAKEDKAHTKASKDLFRAKDVAVDTETAYGDPWCLSFCCSHGTSYVVMADDHEMLYRLNSYLSKPGVNTIIHNAMFDLGILEKMNVKPHTVYDSMVAAYLLQDQPQGLKALGYRLCGVEMNSYTDVVSEVTYDKALDYLHKVYEREWSTPESQIKWVKGEPKVYTPRPLDAKVETMVVDCAMKEADPVKRWANVDVETRLHVSNILGEPMPEGSLADVPLDVAVDYSAQDADITRRIWPILKERLDDLGLWETFELDMSIIPMVAEMQKQGLKLDTSVLTDLRDYLLDEMVKIEDKVAEMAGKRVNLASTKEVGGLLYEKYNLRPKKKSKKTGDPSTDADSLEAIKHRHPVVPLIMEWRVLEKLRGTYTDSIVRKVGLDGRVKPTIRITRTHTGRLATSEPNLMAIPKRSEVGRRVRDAFIADDGRKIVSGDYSQIELRVAAAASGDKAMIKAFLDDQDIHSLTASRIFGIPIDRLDKMRHRLPAKTVNFGILYSISAEGLYDQLKSAGCEGWTVRKCEGLIKEWFNLFEGIKDYFKTVDSEARRYGYVRNMFGRIRRIPEVRSVHFWVADAGIRQARSHVIQGAAQDIMKMSMAKMTPVYQGFQKQGYFCSPLLQIHDDLLYEMDKGIVEEFTKEQKRVMESVVDLPVPIKIDISVGDRWSEV